MRRSGHRRSAGMESGRTVRQRMREDLTRQAIQFLVERRWPTGWSAVPNRFLMGNWRWIPRWRFPPMKDLDIQSLARSRMRRAGPATPAEKRHLVAALRSAVRALSLRSAALFLTIWLSVQNCWSPRHRFLLQPTPLAHGPSRHPSRYSLLRLWLR